MLIADMRHYLGQDLGLIKLPAPAAKLRDYLGSIVAAVTLRNDWETNKETPISCRRQPGHRRCEGNIVAVFDEAEPSAGLPLFLVPVAMRVYHTYSPCLEQGGA